MREKEISTNDSQAKKNELNKKEGESGRERENHWIGEREKNSQYWAQKYFAEKLLFRKHGNIQEPRQVDSVQIFEKLLRGFIKFI